ncbi:hypothetical protein K440DRAFT_407540 [Wilcoxina mikolae CBS 423.85]|nr:hypothetical protein K440DRAFT_407540 [Wilcoxina mikolae CBS 423.85]
MLSTIASAVTGTTVPGANDTTTVERRNDGSSSSFSSVPTRKQQSTTRDGATQTSDCGFGPMDSYNTPNIAISPKAVTKQNVPTTFVAPNPTTSRAILLLVLPTPNLQELSLHLSPIQLRSLS